MLFLLPITGWLMSSASAYSVSWFNLFVLPDLISPNETLKAQLLALHEAMAESLFVLAALHIGAALKHALFDRDDVLRRMWHPASAATGVALVALGLAFLAAGLRVLRGLRRTAHTLAQQVHERCITQDHANNEEPDDAFQFITGKAQHK